MGKVFTLDSSNRHVSYTEWENFPTSSPLAKQFRSILWTVITERSDKYQCNTCDNPSEFITQRIPIQLKTHDGEVVSVNSLDEERRGIIESMRSGIFALCYSHYLKAYADTLPDIED